MAVSERAHDQQVLAGLIPLAGETIIDIGSGAGGLVAWLQRRGAIAIGVEYSLAMLAQVQAIGVRTIRADGQQLPIADASMSCALFINSLHHIPIDGMERALAEAGRVVRPGGRIYVLEPVAEGAGYEVDRIIDDEAEVRAFAQQAMDRVATQVFDPIESGHYLTDYVYRDVDAYLTTMVGVDGSRAAQIERCRAEVEEEFNRRGRRTSYGVAFDQPMHYRLFAKRQRT